MNKRIILTLAACAVMFFVGVSQGRAATGTVVYVDCGQVGAHTVIVTTNLYQYLATHPHAQLTPCVSAPVVVLPPAISQTFLCYSHFLGATPGVVDWSLVTLRLSQGWFTPIAITKAEADKQQIASWARSVVAGYVLACNPDGLAGTGTGLDGSEGDFQNAITWKQTLTEYGSNHVNHYEIVK